MLFARRPIWTSRRARGASSPRLYGVRRIRKIPPFVAKQKVFGIPIPRAQKESASSLRSKHALRDDDELVIDECEAELAYIFARPSAENTPPSPRPWAAGGRRCGSLAECLIAAKASF